MCEFYLHHGSVLAQRIIYTVCLLSSLFASVYLIWVCAWRLRSHLMKLFVQQLLALSTTNFLLAIWSYAVPCFQRGTLLWPGYPWGWCAAFNGIRRCLQMCSALFAVSIAAGLVAAMLKRPRLLAVLRAAPALVLPMAVALNIGYIMFPSRDADPSGRWMPHDIPTAYCESVEPSQLIFGTELIVLFCLILICTVWGLCRLRHSAPNGVRRRAGRTAAKYLLAFFCSFAFYCGSQVYVLHISNWSVVPQLPVTTCSFWTVHLGRDLLLILNGVFVFLAFWSHANHLTRTSDSGHRVSRLQFGAGFRSRVSVREILTARASDASQPDLGEDTGRLPRFSIAPPQIGSNPAIDVWSTILESD